jgi:hypothetical protein
VPQLHAASRVARPIRNHDSTEKISRAMVDFFASALDFEYAADFVVGVFPGRPLLVTWSLPPA